MTSARPAEALRIRARGIGREAVNYGHTLGHAIEKLEHHAIRHGEAISIGMVFVAELAHRTGRIDAALLEQHRTVLAAAGLPITYDGERGGTTCWPRCDWTRSRAATSCASWCSTRWRSPTVLAGPDEILLHDSFRAVTA